MSDRDSEASSILTLAPAEQHYPFVAAVRVPLAVVLSCCLEHAERMAMAASYRYPSFV
jgi:hypothetical protein